MKFLLIKLIRLYQLCLSPWLGRQCRFTPSCSHYGIQAILRFGALRGSYLTVIRISNAIPWVPGDMIPYPRNSTGISGKTVNGLYQPTFFC